ncbi:MAG TPA: DUF4131 domain-containing protein, partial [Thermoleophilia bacterium]|nr:DUF4131 domain-containing protein [Thermoleophilia bacterium]
MRAPPTVHLLLLAYVGGLVGALAWRPSGAAAAALTGAAALWALVRLTRRLPARRLRGAAVLGLAPLFVAAGIGVGAARLDARAHSRLLPLAGHTVAMRATALTLPKVNGDRVSLDVAVNTVDGVPVAERAPLTLDLGAASAPAFSSLGPLVEGTRLSLPAVQIEPLPAPKPGAFDYGRYLERRGG